MCGIVGYIGGNEAAKFLIDGLTKLEYRGYDSAGIAVYNGENIRVEKSEGKLANLKAKIAGDTPAGNIGIGHTRWATHGGPSDVNSHPHTDCNGDFAVVQRNVEINAYQNVLSLYVQILYILLVELAHSSFSFRL